MTIPFTLHPQLVADCHLIGRCGVLHLLLHRNAMLPWFIVVPETDVTELYELPESSRRALLDFADKLARFIKRHFVCEKINIAAIGNVVPQLHLHVVGRRSDDNCWPLAPWGHLSATRHYDPEELLRITEAIASELSVR
ncbi:MAG: HIT family protein [Gammaproteobacteria bacterium]